MVNSELWDEFENRSFWYTRIESMATAVQRNSVSSGQLASLLRKLVSDYHFGLLGECERFAFVLSFAPQNSESIYECRLLAITAQGKNKES